MSVGKIAGEGSGQAAAEGVTEGVAQGTAQAAAQGLAQEVAGAGGEVVQPSAAVAGGVAQAVAAAGGADQGGTAAAGAALGGVAGIAGSVAGAGAGGGVGGAAGGIVGGAAGGAGGAIGGVVGGVAGAAGQVAGAVGGLTGGGAGNIVGAVGGLTGAAGTVTGAVGGLVGGEAGQVIGAVGGIVGAAGTVIGAVGGIVSAAEAGSAAGVAAGIAGGISGGVSGIAAAADLPFFEDKAITSSIGQAGQVLGSVAGAVAGIAGAVAGNAAGGGSGNLAVEVASEDVLHVRQFSVHERISSLFDVSLLVRSENASIDFDEVVGKPARFSVHAGAHDRSWSGLCNHLELVGVEPDGLSTYQVSIVPMLWLLSQRRNYRMFQQISEPDIVLQILREWDIEPDVRIDRAAYRTRRYRVQYAESDLAFIHRMLEDVGICYFFEEDDGETKLVLSDAPQANPPRQPAVPFMEDVTAVRRVEVEFVTAVRMGQRVRPGKVTLRDHDYRRPPSYPLMRTAAGGRGVEERLERYHYTPGAFLFGTDQGESTPVADDRGRTRTDEREAAILAQKRLDAKRGSARVCGFETNAHDLAPGVVMRIEDHPHAALEGALLIVKSSFGGTDVGEWSHQCEARGTDIPFRPELVTPKPKVNGVESATVVGPQGEEIHTDEFGRVRVHFHWDRESRMDENSSCWIHVSQPWGGAGYGATNLPRIGQEVLVDFLGGDPDRPVIVGRVYTNLQRTPYRLPENRTQSGWRSNSTGGTGGYNEMMFEDAQGRELVRMHAQRDMNQVIRHDEIHAVGRDRTRRVRRNEDVTIGQDLTKRVVGNETETTRLNRTISVGIDRQSTIGYVDSINVGEKFEVIVVPPQEEESSEEPLESLPEEEEMSRAEPCSSCGGCTMTTMTDKKIVLTTGAGATITMEADKITIEANTVEVLARGAGMGEGQLALTLKADGGDVLIQGGPMVHINPE